MKMMDNIRLTYNPPCKARDDQRYGMVRKIVE